MRQSYARAQDRCLVPAPPPNAQDATAFSFDEMRLLTSLCDGDSAAEAHQTVANINGRTGFRNIACDLDTPARERRVPPYSPHLCSVSFSVRPGVGVTLKGRHRSDPDFTPIAIRAEKLEQSLSFGLQTKYHQFLAAPCRKNDFRNENPHSHTGDTRGTRD